MLRELLDYYLSGGVAVDAVVLLGLLGVLIGALAFRRPTSRTLIPAAIVSPMVLLLFGGILTSWQIWEANQPLAITPADQFAEANSIHYGFRFAAAAYPLAWAAVMSIPQLIIVAATFARRPRPIAEP